MDIKKIEFHITNASLGEEYFGRSPAPFLTLSFASLNGAGSGCFGVPSAFADQALRIPNAEEGNLLGDC